MIADENNPNGADSGPSEPAEAPAPPPPAPPAKPPTKPRNKQAAVNALAYPWVDKIRHPKKRAMLACYAKSGNLLEASKVARVSRAIHYVWLAEDPDYKAAVNDARQLAIEGMEAIADKLAFQGVLRPVFYAGQRCGSIREHNATLIMFRLKRLDPSYRERVDVGLSGPVTKRYVGVDVEQV